MLTECPKGHMRHDSLLLAQNWKTVHEMINPACPGINIIPCGDHYHIGHYNRRQKAKCLEGGSIAVRRYDSAREV